MCVCRCLFVPLSRQSIGSHTPQPWEQPCAQDQSRQCPWVKQCTYKIFFRVYKSPTPANNSSLLDDESLLQHRVSSSPAKELKFACSWGLMTISGLILNLSTCSLLLGSLPHLNGGVEGIKTAKQCGKLRLFSRLAWQQSRHHDKRPLSKHESDCKL